MQFTSNSEACLMDMCQNFHSFSRTLGTIYLPNMPGRHAQSSAISSSPRAEHPTSSRLQAVSMPPSSCLHVLQAQREREAPMVSLPIFPIDVASFADGPISFIWPFFRAQISASRIQHFCLRSPDATRDEQQHDGKQGSPPVPTLFVDSHG
jgi:hypothetical protein